MGAFVIVELLIGHSAPVVRCVVQGKARSETSIGSNDQPVLPGAASPVLADAAHGALHVPEARNRIDHLPALTLLVDEPAHWKDNFMPSCHGAAAS